MMSINDMLALDYYWDINSTGFNALDHLFMTESALYRAMKLLMLAYLIPRLTVL
jgi:hypothetical protein